MLLLCPQVCSSVYIHGFWLASVRTGVSVHHHWCNDCHGVYCSVNPRCWIWKLERWTYRGICFRRSAFTFKHRSKDKNVQRVSRMMYFSSCILLQHVYIYIYPPHVSLSHDAQSSIYAMPGPSRKARRLAWLYSRGATWHGRCFSPCVDGISLYRPIPSKSLNFNSINDHQLI